MRKKSTSENIIARPNRNRNSLGKMTKALKVSNRNVKSSKVAKILKLTSEPSENEKC